MQEHIRFPSIEQFRTVIQKVKHKTRLIGVDDAGEPLYDHTKKLPVLDFEGTVKLHGTNAAVIIGPLGGLTFQSRERILSVENDNAGFAFWGRSYGDNFYEIMSIVSSTVNYKGPLTLFGEWCGGSIQAGVAISKLKKMFVIFKIKAGDTWYNPSDFPDLKSYPDRETYLIHDFPTFSISIDFENPALSQNTLIELTTKVEECCPVGKTFGIEGTGEGIVWSCITPGLETSELWFKVKGEKHSSSKVKTLAAVDLEKVASVEAFLEKCVTDNRLLQSIAFLKETNRALDVKSTGDFVRWVYNDILKEETDTIVESGLEPKDVGSAVSNKARRWYFDYLDSINFK
ncbi:MAG: hypothetical protein JHC33_03950 [Ignisphaera sp.]|nr:hypothetical protein [Ignisphaera sp.]